MLSVVSIYDVMLNGSSRWISVFWLLCRDSWDTDCTIQQKLILNACYESPQLKDKLLNHQTDFFFFFTWLSILRLFYIYSPCKMSPLVTELYQRVACSDNELYFTLKDTMIFKLTLILTMKKIVWIKWWVFQLVDQ